MSKIVIVGGKRLEGTVKISGSKNASLPILVASLLTDELCVLSGIPKLYDVEIINALLIHLGKKIRIKEGKIYISASGKLCLDAPYDLVSKMRASVLVMGPLLARYKKAKVSLPGGCAIGSRPINLHLEGLIKLGAEVDIKKGFVNVGAGNGLTGGKIYLDFPSVGATENLIMAAVLAKGYTAIENAAREPEIIDLACFLNKMGAKISGAGTDIIEIQGVDKLKGVKYTVIPDRIEAGTFLLAAAITRGKIELLNANASHIESVIAKIREAHVKVSIKKDKIEVSAPKTLKPIDISTSTYPGFPTDMQAQWMAFMSVIPGVSILTENIFENRFMHVGELQRMGADIQIKGSSAVVTGVSRLSGAQVKATDLRASAALVLAGLVAEGETSIYNIQHLDRGYEAMENKLKKLGAQIKRVEE